MNVTNKFNEIADDLTYNVTRMYGRQDIIIASDLVFHSVISFPFRGEMIDKGWTEAIIIGDTGSGKSKTLERLHRHYRVGEFITGEDVSRAGLIGGMQQLGGRWTITWGRYVRQNREQCTIDETQNLAPEDIANMTGMRSSGIAELTLIHQARTEAKVRAIWLGNPRGNRFMNTYSQGIRAVKDLIGKLDDIRRFDIGVACGIDEIPIDDYNKAKYKTVEHVYTSDKCHDLIMWAWSRKAEDVKFVEDSDLMILEVAKELGDMYTSQIPLVNYSEMREKLARLAVAAAVRVFSTDDSFQKVLVKPEHVEFIREFLLRCYNKPTMGYDIYTNVIKAEQTLEDEEKVLELISEQGENFVNCLLQYDYLTMSDVMDFTGDDRDGAKETISFLVRNRCIKKFHAQYTKTPAFIKLLRCIKTDGIDILEKKFNIKEDEKDAEQYSFEG